MRANGNTGPLTGSGQIAVAKLERTIEQDLSEKIVTEVRRILPPRIADNDPKFEVSAQVQAHIGHYADALNLQLKPNTTTDVGSPWLIQSINIGLHLEGGNFSKPVVSKLEKHLQFFLQRRGYSMEAENSGRVWKPVAQLQVTYQPAGHQLWYQKPQTALIAAALFSLLSFFMIILRELLFNRGSTRSSTTPASKNDIKNRPSVTPLDATSLLNTPDQVIYQIFRDLPFSAAMEVLRDAPDCDRIKVINKLNLTPGIRDQILYELASTAPRKS